MEIRIFDRSGQPITFEDWVRAIEPGSSYPRVAQDDIDTDLGPVFVSTVWVGLDRSFGGSVPVIFETMAFERNNFRAPLRIERWSSEAQALSGHDQMVAELRHLHAPKVNSDGV